ncbi:N-acetylglucosaminyl-diphospho-decaprenol L-rhamnosyltransferase [Nymphon striatum]|nr:N-acetylglucosaminyl-diphospho-decaprenol L-rhamnosyltransferase [Nymphon striatum]
MVDNDSKDNSVELIASEFPEVEIIQTGQNLGFAGGVNVGAKASNSEYILLLNPDTVILDGAIDKLFEYAQSTPKAGVWGGITLNNDLSLNPNNARARLSFKTLLFSALGLSKAFNKSCFFNHDNYGCWDRKSEREVDVVTGCFFLTPRHLWTDLQGLDETFFMYAEEADYCIRAIKKGYQPRARLSTAFSHPILVLLGEASYSLYILQKPIHEELLEDSGGLDLKEFINVLKNHKKLILSIALATMLIALLLTLLDATEASRSDRDFFETQIQLIQTKTLASRVINELGLDKKPESAGLVSSLKNLITGNKAADGTDLLSISYDSSSPQLAADINNAIANTFVRQNLERRFDTASSYKTYVSDNIEVTKKSLEEAEKRLNDYARENNIVQDVDG